jgi:hypothetical protein
MGNDLKNTPMYICKMDALSLRALSLISQFSKPLTRPDWRKGSYLKRAWGTYEGRNTFQTELIFESPTYDKIYEEVEQYVGNTLFVSNYLPTTYIDLYKHGRKTSEIVDAIIFKSI